MKSHDAGDAAIHEVLSRVSREVGRIVADIATLHDLLAAGAGDPIPGELTPTEYDFLATHLGRIGMAGALLLAEDLATTDAREGSDWPEDAPPRPPRGRPH